MPRRKQEPVEFESEEESIDYEPEPEEQYDEINIEEELKLARESLKSKKLKKEEDQLAKQIKRERLAKSKEYPPQPKRSGRYEKGSEEAKEWAKMMQEAKQRKKQARDSENKRQEQREVMTKEKLEEAQEAKIRALQKKIDQYQAEASQPVEVPTPRPKRTYTRKQKVVETPDNTEDDTEFEEVKKIVRKKRQQKAVASQHIESERRRIEDELYLQQMRSVIPNYGM